MYIIHVHVVDSVSREYVEQVILLPRVEPKTAGLYAVFSFTSVVGLARLKV